MGSLLENELHHAVGMSDLSMLLVEAFSFPKDERLAAALLDGSFSCDWHASWKDATTKLGSTKGGEKGNPPDPLTPELEGVLLHADVAELRKEYSRLFLTPGVDVPIWLYESAFLHREAGLEDMPILFRSKITLDVEEKMADAGVRPEHLRTEPCDSCAMELRFLSYLFAMRGDAFSVASLNEAAPNEMALSEWKQRIDDFVGAHILKWLPAFFDQVDKKAERREYAVFAELGSAFVELLSR